MAEALLTQSPWNPNRPRLLVLACSDGRLQENLDDFLGASLGVSHYDRLYAPGGGGALADSGFDHMRADLFRRECRFLLKAHSIETMLLIFHGPSGDGPAEAVCADYRRKLPSGSIEEIRRQQESDAWDVKRLAWGMPLAIHAYRCEVRGDGRVQFAPLALETAPPREGGHRLT